VQRIHNVGIQGAHGVAAAPELFEASWAHPSTQSSVQQFNDERKKFYGDILILIPIIFVIQN
jgi:hypothetical protein